MRKLFMLGVFLVIMFTCLANATLVGDTFSDNFLDDTIWWNTTTIGNFTVKEQNYRLEFFGNYTYVNCGAGAVKFFMQNHQEVGANESVYFSFTFQELTGYGANDYFEVDLADLDYNDLLQGIPPTSKGVGFATMTDGVYAFIRDGQRISNIQSRDTAVHEIRINAIRNIEASATDYSFYFDDVLITTESQSGLNLLNLTFAISDCTNNTYNHYIIDDVSFSMYLAGNVTGASCTQNSDCDCGNCEYGFCSLNGARDPCTRDDCCLSGVCSNGKCTKPEFMDLIDNSIAQQFGDSDETYNFIAMFFMIAIPVAVIFAGRCMVAVLGAIVIYYGLAGFFTIIGWLSPFILVLSVLTGLILIVLGFVIGLKGD